MSARPCTASIALCLGITLAGGDHQATASEVPETGRIWYRVTNAKGTECFERDRLARAVAALLAHTSAPIPDRRVSASVRSEDEDIVAQLQLRDQEGNVLGNRQIRAPLMRCTELVDAAALTVALAVDPTIVDRVGSSSEPASKGQPSLPQATIDNDTPAAAEGGGAARREESMRSRPRLWVATSGIVALGASVKPAGGAALQLGLRWRWLSLAAEGRFEAATSQDLTAGSLTTQLLGGSLIACGHYSVVFGCGSLTAAAFSGTGQDLIDAKSVTLPYYGAGVRAGVELPLWGPLSIRAHGELLLPFSRLHLRDSLEQTTFYTTSAAAGTFGLGLVGTVL